MNRHPPEIYIVSRREVALSGNGLFNLRIDNRRQSVFCGNFWLFFQTLFLRLHKIKTRT